jgi:hypothetical protein
VKWPMRAVDFRCEAAVGVTSRLARGLAACG